MGVAHANHANYANYANYSVWKLMTSVTTKKRSVTRRKKTDFHLKMRPQSLISEANSHKVEANALFIAGDCDAAIKKYGEAVAVCPTYRLYELAVLRSNMAACHLKLQDWKEAIGSATVALDKLEALEHMGKEAAAAAAPGTAAAGSDVRPVAASPGSQPTGSRSGKEEVPCQQRQTDIERIRAKSLMRRARARSEQGGWSNLEGALEDYKSLASMENLGRADRAVVDRQLLSLPPRVKSAQEEETAEMWGKLKDLGNGFLKPFGISTDNFKMVKDEKTGGYSMNFQGGGG